MMGVLVFMVDGKMCVGAKGDSLMVRLDPAEVVVALHEPGCQPMRISGRTLRGFILVEGKALDSDKVLGSWLKRALAFKPKVVAPKKTRSIQENLLRGDMLGTKAGLGTLNQRPAANLLHCIWQSAAAA